MKCGVPIELVLSEIEARQSRLLGGNDGVRILGGQAPGPYDTLRGDGQQTDLLIPDAGEEDDDLDDFWVEATT